MKLFQHLLATATVVAITFHASTAEDGAVRENYNQDQKHRLERRHAQRQRLHHYDERVLPNSQRKENNDDRDDDTDDEKEMEKKKRRSDGDASDDNEDIEQDDRKEKKTQQKTKMNQRRGVDTINLFDTIPSPVPTSAAPSPTPTETVCKSIIAVGSTRLHPNDPYLRTLPPDDARKLQEDTAGDEEFVCELHTGDFVPLHSTSKQLKALREALQVGALVSSVSTIEYVIPETVIVNEGGEPLFIEEGEDEEEEYHGPGGKTTVPSTVPSSYPTSAVTMTVIESVVLPPGEILIHTDPIVLDEHKGRRHLRYSGTKPMLVVRVIDANGVAPMGGDASYISNKFFGTLGDPETMLSQFGSCSYGKFNVVYDQQYGENEGYIKSQLSAPGVLEVQIPITMYNTKNDIRKATMLAVEAKIAMKLPGPFAHVLFVLPQCVLDCGYAAYAFVGSYLSVYQGVYYQYPAVAMHEIGHNLNLGHSGGKTPEGMDCSYCDHTDLMGNPLYKDDVADMCFNPAKTYQITANGGEWYDHTRFETFDPMTGGTWAGTLIGIAELGNLYGNAEHATSRIVLKIETGATIDLYIGFNRAMGINEDVKQGPNMVTIVEANGDGLSYSTSMLLAILGQGQSYSVANWRGTGVTLTVIVDLIRYIDVVPGYATVRVMFDGQRAGGITTVPPTRRPTRQPVTSRPKPGIPPPPPPPTEPPVALPPTPLPTPSPTLIPLTPSPVTPSPISLSPTDGMFVYSTNIDNSKGKSKSIMFTVTNIDDRNVIIEELDIVNRRNADTLVTIYAQSGSLDELGDYAFNDYSWGNHIYQSVKSGQPLKLMELDVLNAPITIFPGASVSFYVHSASGLMYARLDGGSDPDEMEEGDAHIAISVGRVMRGLFRNHIGPGKWAGLIKYYIE